MSYKYIQMKKIFFHELFLGYVPAIHLDPVMYRCQCHNFVNRLPF